jgi:hypothetical protein
MCSTVRLWRLRFRRVTLVFAAMLLIGCAGSVLAQQSVTPSASPPAATATPAAPQAPYRTARGASYIIQKFTGLNALSRLLSSSVATSVLRKLVGGKSRVRIQTRTMTDLIAGKMQQIDVEIKDAQYRGIPIRELEMHSTPNVWLRYFKSKQGKPGARAPLMFAVKGRVHETDISATLASPNVATALRMVKLDLPGMGHQQLQFLNPKVDIEPGKVLINSRVITAGAAPETGVDVAISASPYLDGDKVMVRDFDMQSADIENPSEFSKFIEPLINPLVNLARLDRADHAFRLTEFKVDKDLVEFSGNLLIAPRPTKSK